MQTEINHRLSSGLTLNSSWTWAKDLSDAGGPAPTRWSGDTGGGRVTNSLNRRLDRGDVAMVRRHRWLTSAVYELPFGRGRAVGRDMGRFADAIVGGWHLSGIFLLQTGTHMTPTMSGGDPSGTGGDSRGSQRPDSVGHQSHAFQSDRGHVLDRAALFARGARQGLLTSSTATP